MGHLQPGAGRPLFQCGEKVNYTPQAVWAWWQRGSGDAVGTIQQQGAVGLSHVKKEMEEGDGVIEGSKRKWRDGHEDGNLKETGKCWRCEEECAEQKADCKIGSLHLG